MQKVTPLSQQDPRWKNTLLGNDATSIIGTYGCLLTDLTVVANACGANETPSSLNDKMKTAGGFQGANVIPAVLPQVVPGVRFLRFQDCKNYPAPLADIDSALAAGQAVIVQVDYSPAAGLQSHWVILTEKVGADYAIFDPWPYPGDSGQVLLSQRFGFSGTPQKIILAVTWLDDTNPPPMPAPVAIPTSGVVVNPTVDGLALRSSPQVAADNLITRLPQSTNLYFNEDPGAAAAKIGQVGQWLAVIESHQGYPGYVAAWYVASAAGTVSAPLELQPYNPPEHEPPAAPPLTVYAAVDNLALRTQPVVDPSTLIKRIAVNTSLTVLEDFTAALGKLGQNGQWLNVQDDAASQGYCAAWLVSQYSQPVLGAGSPPVNNPPQTPLTVVTSIDNLAFRTQPTIDPSTLIRRVPIQTIFTVVEPAAQAMAKLGVNGQWLNVQAGDGSTGYVAAWYVIQQPPVVNP